MIENATYDKDLAEKFLKVKRTAGYMFVNGERFDGPDIVSLVRSLVGYIQSKEKRGKWKDLNLQVAAEKLIADNEIVLQSANTDAENLLAYSKDLQSKIKEMGDLIAGTAPLIPA